MNSKIVISALTLIVTLGVTAGVWDKDKHKNKRYSFENQNEIKNFRSDPGGNISVSRDHFKEGEKSLKWQFSPMSSISLFDKQGLEITENILYQKRKWGGIKLWIYNEKPLKGFLKFQIGSKLEINKNKPKYEFDFNLNFKGWRAAWVAFNADTRKPGDQKQPLEEMKITALTKGKGKIYFDRLELNEYIFWAREADWQLPHLNKRMKGGPDGTLRSHNIKVPVKFNIKPAKSELDSLPIIESRIREWFLGNGRYENMIVKQQYKNIISSVKTALAKYDQFNIRRKNGIITGKPLFAVCHSASPEIHVLVNECLLPLALAYNIKGPADAPNPHWHSQDLKNKIIDAFDYANDQGWAEGSSMGTCYGVHLGMTGYCFAIFLMKKELNDAGILDREVATFKWYSHFKDFFLEKDIPGWGGADEIRTTAFFRLVYIISMDNKNEQIVLMRKMKKWLNNALTVTRGLNAFIKPDYSAFHHQAAYWNGYGANALNMAALISYILRGTDFATSKSSWLNLKKALMTINFICNKYDLPVPLNGRWPFWKNSLLSTLDGYAYAAAVYSEYDRDLASSFKRLFDLKHKAVKSRLSKVAYRGNQFTSTLGNTQNILKLNKEFESTPSSAPTAGHLTLPYAGASFHRRNGWMAFVKGWSRYIWDFEIGESNHLGRYLSRGFLGIYGSGSPVSMNASGFDWQGWDWARFPGTTVINLPNKELYVTKAQDPSRHFTDQTFVGGLKHGNNGIFVLQLHDSVYEKSFWANKTYFFHNDFIVALGSGIRNRVKDRHTETTLFQSKIVNSKNGSCINSKYFKRMPMTKSLKGSTYILNSQSNGYYLPNAMNTFFIRKVQSIQKLGRHTGGKNPFEIAYIDHGKAPRKAEYEYAVIPKTNKQRLTKFAKNPPYKVIVKNNSAHIVHFKNTETTGYVLFKSGKTDDSGILKQVNRPCLIMITPSSESKKINISVADPDIGASWTPALPKKNWYSPKAIFTSKGRVLRIMLKGKWEKVSGDLLHISYAGDSTIISINCKDGKSYNAVLAAKK